MHPALLGLVTIIVGVGGCVGYFYFSNVFLDKVLYPPSGPNAGRNINRANLIRPWLFLSPAILALGLYLGYPVIETLRLSLTDRDQGGAFVGLANYQQMIERTQVLGSHAQQHALADRCARCLDRLWPAGRTADRPDFMGQPCQIADLHADGDFLCRRVSVIFKLIYDTRPEGQDADRCDERGLAAIRRRGRVLPVPQNSSRHHGHLLRRDRGLCRLSADHAR